jgi:hypothetical protein
VGDGGGGGGGDGRDSQHGSQRAGAAETRGRRVSQEEQEEQEQVLGASVKGQAQAQIREESSGTGHARRQLPSTIWHKHKHRTLPNRYEGIDDTAGRWEEEASALDEQWSWRGTL